MDTTFSRSLGLALVLHTGVVVAGRWIAEPVAALRLPAQVSYEISVVEVPAEWQREPAVESSLGGLALGTTPRGLGASATTRGTPGPVAGVASSEPVGSGSPEASEAPQPAAERPIDLGLGGLWARAGLPDRPKRGWKSGADAAGGLGQGLEERDQERGLGRGGVVATLARGAAIRSGPTEGEASFTVETDREGRVASVTLGEARGGASWSDVASALRRALASKRLRVPQGSNGLRVQVQVRARVQLPSGSRPGRAVTVHGAGAEFDVADIGARPARVVSARVTSERLL